MSPRRHTLRSVASNGENSDEAFTQPADQHIRGQGQGRGQEAQGRGRGRGPRVSGGKAAQATRGSIPTEIENHFPQRRSALEAVVVGLQGVVEALTEYGYFSKKHKWGSEGKSLVQGGSIRGSKLQNQAHTQPEAPTSST
ncbi:uncharacterized protein G2W53_029141 [Senna tora]|uniref:Uncharacterized protein n=1 Tax=Senna tora TaxID=362788 RepID=A0A834T4M7_9FABA|nr:uncharacterized protein G2W53_029141 [Senna tora]